MWKTLERASRRVSFLYFPNTALDHGGCPHWLSHPLTVKKNVFLGYTEKAFHDFEN